MDESVNPSHPSLCHLLKDLLESSDVMLRARAENFRFEERVSVARQEQYESNHGPTGATYEHWLESHADYLAASVYKALPETFQILNADAALPNAVSSALGEEQVLIRVESLDYALTEIKTSLADLEDTLEIYRGKRDPNITGGDAKALLQKVCNSLNRNPNAVRPRFAAFAQELEEDIDASNWPQRLRDLLGLAHLPPTNCYGPHPVVLMRYKVKEVSERARTLQAGHPLAVPTALDAEPYEIFHPSPREQDYGRTLNLAGIGDGNRLTSEVLHMQMDYNPSHIWKIGSITARADASPERVLKLRGDHLALLQLLSNRDDFGVL